MCECLSTTRGSPKVSGTMAMTVTGTMCAGFYWFFASGKDRISDKREGAAEA